MRIKRAYDDTIGKALNMKHLITLTLSELEHLNNGKPAQATIRQAETTLKEIKSFKSLLEVTSSKVDDYLDNEASLATVLNDDHYSKA